MEKQVSKRKVSDKQSAAPVTANKKLKSSDSKLVMPHCVICHKNFNDAENVYNSCVVEHSQGECKQFKNHHGKGAKYSVSCNRCRKTNKEYCSHPSDLHFLRGTCYTGPHSIHIENIPSQWLKSQFPECDKCNDVVCE